MPATQRFTSFHALILGAMEVAQQRPLAAVDLALEWLEADEDLYEEVVKRLLRQACLESCYSIHHKNRLAIIEEVRSQPTPHSPAPPPTRSHPPLSPRQQAVIMAGVQRSVSRLMEFPLTNGMPLREAARPEIQETRRHYAKQVRTMDINERWLGRIDRALPDDVIKVGKALTEDQLRKFYNAVEIQEEQRGKKG